MEELHEDTRRYVRTGTYLPNHLDLNILRVCLFTTLVIAQKRAASAENMLLIKAVRKINMQDLRL